MRLILGLLIATSFIFPGDTASSRAVPMKEFFLNRAKAFQRKAALRLRGKSPEIVARITEKLDSFFRKVAGSRRSMWFFNNFARNLDWSSIFKFGEMEIYSNSEEYFFNGQLSNALLSSNFGLDVLEISNVNVLTETAGWIEDSVRENLMGRLMTVFSRVGGQKRSLVKLYQTLQTLPSSELQKEVGTLEKQVRQLMATSSSLVQEELYAKLAGEPYLDSYRSLLGDQEEVIISEAKSELNSIAQGITSEARVCILPRLLVFIDWLVSSSPTITSSSSSSGFILRRTLVEVIVRIANNLKTSKISLFSFIDHVEFRSRDLFQPKNEPAEQVYSLAMQVYDLFGISVLELYPALAKSVNWSAGRARAMQRLIKNFILFGVSLSYDFYDIVPPYDNGGPIFKDRVKRLISQARDASLIEGAHVVSRLLRAHWHMQAKGIFVEPLVNPAVWLAEYAKENGPSRFASWVSKTLPPHDGIIRYLKSRNPLPEAVSRKKTEYPPRFIRMSKTLSSIHEIYDDELGLIPRKGMREIVMLPSAVMRSEVRWGILDAGNNPDYQKIQSLIEDTALIIIDAIKIIVESTNEVNPETRAQIIRCFDALGSFLKAESLTNLNMVLMERIHSESDQVRSSATQKSLVHERLCEIIPPFRG